MKTKIFLSLALIIMLSLKVQAVQTVKCNNINEFTKIELNGNLSVELIQSEQTSMDIIISEGDISDLKWSVKSQTLRVSLKGGTKSKASIKLSYSTLNSIFANGITLSSKQPLESSILDIFAYQGSIIDLPINTLDLKLISSHNSIVQLTGSAKHLRIHAREKSKIDTRSISAESIDAEANSKAEIFVLAIERLEAKTSTGAKIHYIGEPKVLRALTPRILKFGSGVDPLD